MVKIIFTIVFIWIYGNIVTILERLLKSPFKTHELVPDYHYGEFRFFTSIIVVIVSILCAVKLDKYLLVKGAKRGIRESLLPSPLFSVIVLVLFFFCFSVLIDFEKSFVIPLLPLPDEPACYHIVEPPLWIELFCLDETRHIDVVMNLNNLFLISILSGLSSLIFTEKLDRLLLWAWKKVKYKIM